MAALSVGSRVEELGKSVGEGKKKSSRSQKEEKVEEAFQGFKRPWVTSQFLFLNMFKSHFQKVIGKATLDSKKKNGSISILHKVL